MSTSRVCVFVLCAVVLAGCEFLAPRSDCSDDRINGDETDVDCGGPLCPKCLAGQLCAGNGDCTTGLCQLARCVEPTCSDGVKNGAETDVDCGGTCAKCAVTKSCMGASDCESNVCDAQRCVAASVPSCTNGQRDGQETDVDCGGPGSCPRCAPTAMCGRDEDCASQLCNGGRCAAPCTSPLQACSRMCVNPMTDRAHCGMCGNACASNSMCVAGQCETPCPFGSLRCPGPACIDVMMNNTHCGMCGRACGMNEVCLGGMCVNPCPMGLTPCPPNLCVDKQVDDNHCGVCGRACGPTESCVDGQCTSVCTMPMTACPIDGGVDCTDTTFDPDHCFMCGNACPQLPNAVRTCQAGSCVLGACFPSFDDCNTMPADGCEAQLPVDNQNCGICGHVCQGGDTCQLGRCCGPLPPGPYQMTCANCEACNGMLRCDCQDQMQVPRPASLSLPCVEMVSNCEGTLTCGMCP